VAYQYNDEGYHETDLSYMKQYMIEPEDEDSKTLHDFFNVELHPTPHTTLHNIKTYPKARESERHVHPWW
jgi:hypothetical protein